MTSKLTREFMQNIISGHGFGVAPSAVKAMAEYIVAAMDSEPVIWNNGCNKSVPAALRYLAENQRPIGGESSFNTAHLYQLAREIELMAEAPLYRHAQPVPVVPYDFDFDRFNDVVWLECVASNPHMHSPTTSIIARVALELNKRILAGNSPVIPDGYRLQPISEYEATCATVNSDEWPQRWVPVSERMPDDDDFVYIWPRPDFGVELHVGQYCECSPKGDGWYAQVYEQNYGIEWYPITVTHWMPLPAAPQEVKGD